MNDTVFICIPGEPVGKGRPRVGKRGKHIVMFTPPETVEYENRIRHEAHLSMGGRALFSGPVELTMQIFISIPASYSRKKREACMLGRMVPTKKPDTDNVVKAVCDAFNGFVWVDDTQVVDLHVTKRFSEAPSVMVQVRELDLLGINDNVKEVMQSEALF